MPPEAPAGARPGLTAGAPPILGLVAVALALSPGVLAGRTFSMGDLQFMFLGQSDAIVHCVARGSWPLWDPFLGFGQPLLANPGYQVFYPPTWLNLLLAPEACLTAYVLLHLLWAGAGAYALGRRALGLSRWAAWLAGAAWMASGPLQSHVQRWQHFASIAWLPWLVLAARAAVREPGRRSVSILAGVLALQWLAGSVDIAAAALVVAAGWTALETVSGSCPGGARRYFGAWLAAGLLAAGLTAAQWVPAIDLLRGSARAEAVRAQQMWWDVHPLRWVELVTPLRLDEIPLVPPLRRELLGAHGTTIVPSLYAGTVLTALVGFALFAPERRRAALGLAALAGAAVVLAMGSHAGVLPWVAAHLPLLSALRFPGKLTLVLSFAWSQLAALGFDAWRTEHARGRGRGLALWLVAAALPAAGFATAILVRPDLLAGRVVPAPPPGARVLDVLSVEAWACGTALAAAAAALAAVAGRGPLRGSAAAALALVAVADPIAPNHRVNPTVPRELVGAVPETVRLLKLAGAERIHVVEEARPSGERGPTRWDLLPGTPLGVHDALALGFNLTLAGRSAGRWGLRGSYTVESLVVPTVPQYRISEAFVSAYGHPEMVRLLRAGAVSHVVGRSAALEGLIPVADVSSPFLSPVRLFAVPRPLPRTYVVGSAWVGTDEQALRSLLDPVASPEEQIVLSPGPGAVASAAPGFRGRSRITEERPDEITLEADATQPGWLVLVEGYDAGWKATVDGRPAPVVRAGFAFRAVPVPMGRHQVRMRYRPSGVVPGLAGSAAALVLALALVATGVRRPAGA